MTQFDLLCLSDKDVDSAARLIARRAEFGVLSQGQIKLADDSWWNWAGNQLNNAGSQIQKGVQSAYSGSGLKGVVDSASEDAGRRAADAASSQFVQNLKNTWDTTPELRYGLAGAGIGGALGLGSSLFGSKKRKRPLSNMLIGALLGGSAGAGGKHLWDRLTAPGEAQEEESPNKPTVDQQLAQDDRDKAVTKADAANSAPTRDQRVSLGRDAQSLNIKADMKDNKGRIKPFESDVGWDIDAKLNDKGDVDYNVKPYSGLSTSYPVAVGPMNKTQPVRVKEPGKDDKYIGSDELSKLKSRPLDKSEIDNWGTLGRAINHWWKGTNKKRLEAFDPDRVANKNIMFNPVNTPLQIASTVGNAAGGLSGSLGGSPAALAAHLGIPLQKLHDATSPDERVYAEDYTPPPELEPEVQEVIKKSPGIRSSLQSGAALWTGNRLFNAGRGAALGFGAQRITPNERVSIFQPLKKQDSAIYAGLKRLAGGVEGALRGASAGTPLNITGHAAGRFDPALGYARRRAYAEHELRKAQGKLIAPPAAGVDPKTRSLESLLDEYHSGARGLGIGGKLAPSTNKELGLLSSRTGVKQLQDAQRSQGLKGQRYRLWRTGLPYAGVMTGAYLADMGNPRNSTLLERGGVWKRLSDSLAETPSIGLKQKPFDLEEAAAGNSSLKNMWKSMPTPTMSWKRRPGDVIGDTVGMLDPTPVESGMEKKEFAVSTAGDVLDRFLHSMHSNFKAER